MSEVTENLSFARFYRPSTLEGYIGNTNIKETVHNLMSKGQRKQSILLTGTTGCGKTTLARILASWYMCEEPKEDGSPCGKCIPCQYMKDYIKTGNNEMLPDVKEVDVTDKSGKSDMDALIEEIGYPAYGGGWKVYLLDECHAMSLGAGTRLLKLVEEPPENVLIIFITTDPQKMLETLKNRCQLKFTIKKPTTLDLTGLLKNVCNTEGIDYDMIGLRMLASRSDYIIRDALNNLETVISSRGNATSIAVSTEFQEVSDRLIFDFYKAYLEKDYLAYMGVMYSIKTEYDFSIFYSTLMNFTVRGIYVLNNINVDGLTSEEISSYMGVFSKFSIEEISYILSSIRKLTNGDIESNLLSFIYREPLSEGASDMGAVNVPTVKSTPDEVVYRNNNLAKLQESVSKTSDKSVENIMQEVGFDDVSSLFQLERVGQ